jgi:hypothetical protein
MTKGDLKLYVWRGESPLTDYSNGLLVAIGRTPEEALTAARDEGDVPMSEYLAKRMLAESVYEEFDIDGPMGFYAWGGG